MLMKRHDLTVKYESVKMR